MKKYYENPMLDIECFRFEDILTASGLGGDAGIDNGGLDGDDDGGFIPQ